LFLEFWGPNAIFLVYFLFSIVYEARLS
jgi:hypothetical protein